MSKELIAVVELRKWFDGLLRSDIESLIDVVPAHDWLHVAHSCRCRLDMKARKEGSEESS